MPRKRAANGWTTDLEVWQPGAVARNIGQPKKITTIFGRKVTKEYKGKLQSAIEDLNLPNPVIRSH